jgi:hypothetical protein
MLEDVSIVSEVASTNLDLDFTLRLVLGCFGAPHVR